MLAQTCLQIFFKNFWFLLTPFMVTSSCCSCSTNMKTALHFHFLDFSSFRFLCLPALWFFFFFYLFVLFRATPVAYGGSQVRGLIRAVAVGLRQSHSNARSEPHLQSTPQLMARILNPLSKVRDQTCILMDASQIIFCCTTTGTPMIFFK